MGVINVRIVYNEKDSDGIDVEFDAAVFNFMKSLGFREIIKTQSDISFIRGLHYTRVLKEEPK